MQRATYHILKSIAYLREYEEWLANRPLDRWPVDAAPVDDWLAVWSNEPRRTQLNPEVAGWFSSAKLEREGDWLYSTTNGIRRVFQVQETV